jgi:hypothetical protein
MNVSFIAYLCKLKYGDALVIEVVKKGILKK